MELALKLEPLVKKKAKENQEATSTKAPRDEKGRVKPVFDKCEKPVHTSKKLAETAGVSTRLIPGCNESGHGQNTDSPQILGLKLHAE